eukprot:tig00020904_g15155.t1
MSSAFAVAPVAPVRSGRFAASTQSCKITAHKNAALGFGAAGKSEFQGKRMFMTTEKKSQRFVFITSAKMTSGGKDIKRPVIIGVAGDSGCGKSTFLRRLYDIFGTEVTKAHTPVGDLLTVICLDDYHTLDRTGRKEAGVTALDPKANNFDLMYEQVRAAPRPCAPHPRTPASAIDGGPIKALKNGEAIQKPIYNHETGKIDPAETVDPNHIIVVEGLHPMYDKRVRDLLDFSIYLDLSDEIKLAWKVQRDMAERGHKLEDILASIESRKPDFEAYVEPQKGMADVVLSILPTKLIPDDKDHKVLRVQLIQKEGVLGFEPAYLYDEGSTITWVPCGRKLTCSYPGIKFFYGPEEFMGNEVSILEMDGQFEKLEELIYVESHLNNTSTRYYGELTQQILKNQGFPGSNNGTGLFQVLLGMKIRKMYEKLNAQAPALV